MSAPPVTMLLAVYNGERFLRTAIESVLNQTYGDFRFLIVDDCSTDQSARLAESFRDPRIEVLRLPKNVGQTAALNLGVQRISSPWIARMDADDYSAPERLELQMKAVERCPGIHCIGTAAWEFTTRPQVVEQVVRRPVAEDEIRRAALLGKGIIHGSIVIERRALLDAGGYDERYRYASDRELFIRFLRKHRAINLPEALVGCRRTPGQDSYSLKAADEYIDIYQRLLEADGHAVEERGILRSCLAYSYIFRADWYLARGRYREGWGDIVRSFRARPTRAVRTLGGKLLRRVRRGASSLKRMER